MQFTAKARFLRLSPYKLRPLADVIRGKSVPYAIGWLSTCAMQRAVCLKKLLESAVANAQGKDKIDPKRLVISKVLVDEGPSYKYFKPGAMGRSNKYKKRTSHLSIELQVADFTKTKEA